MSGVIKQNLKTVLDATSVALDIRDTRDPTGEVTTFHTPPLSHDSDLMTRLHNVVDGAKTDFSKRAGLECSVRTYLERLKEVYNRDMAKFGYKYSNEGVRTKEEIIFLEWFVEQFGE